MKYISIIILFTLLSCTYLSVEELILDCSNNPIGLNIDAVEADCAVNNGAATIIVTGGLPPYNYQIKEMVQDNNVFTNLVAGNYKVLVIDDNNCSAEMGFVINNKGGVTGSASSTFAGCKTFQGELTINAENGVMPYEYKLNNLAPQTSNIFVGIPAGNHIITIIDDIGCEFIIEKQILSGLSYEIDVKPIIMNSCAVTGCHSGSQFPDFRALQNVQNNKANIRSFTQSRFMPLEGSLTQAEVDAIACWIDDGALDN